MNVNCSTCLELLNPSDELSSVPCGHVFHTSCINQWLDTGKSNCPQCRTKCRASQLRRIYFTQGLDVSQSSATDLQHKLDSLTFQVRCLEKEKKKAVEGQETSSAQAVALREEVRTLEARLASAKEEAESCKAQSRLLLGEKRKADRAKQEATQLREKLNLLKDIEFVVNSSSAEVNQKMHQMGDYSKTSKDLSYQIVALSKELESKGKEASHYRKEMASKQFKADELKASVITLKQANASLISDHEQLKADHQHLEDEVGTLKARLASLQEAIDSPSNDTRQSVIKRLISEHPHPDLMSPPEAKRLKMDSPMAPKACGIVGLHKTKSLPFKEATNFKTSLSQPKTNLLLKNASKINDLASPQGLHYDGMGGHSKLDEFPTPIRKTFKINTTTNKSRSKKPRGVSRPNNSSSKPSTSIDTFFSALTE